MKVGRTRIALAVPLAVAIASLAVGGPSALGKKHHKPTKVAATATLAHNDATGDFTGTLSSSNPICIGMRSVDLWSFGASPSNSPTLLGSATTTPSGQFTFHEPTAQAGFYGVSSPRWTLHQGMKKSKKTFICLAVTFPATNF
ncbi:MAG TPA: hypothetical protein VNY83_00175 [Solirubrobacterales bacterium]|jgi:hypothetical protein|nr:hypothetical protein [Solirubrobacterales bacterium]